MFLCVYGKKIKLRKKILNKHLPKWTQNYSHYLINIYKNYMEKNIIYKTTIPPSPIWDETLNYPNLNGEVDGEDSVLYLITLKKKLKKINLESSINNKRKEFYKSSNEIWSDIIDSIKKEEQNTYKQYNKLNILSNSYKKDILNGNVISIF